MSRPSKKVFPADSNAASITSSAAATEAPQEQPPPLAPVQAPRQHREGAVKHYHIHHRNDKDNKEKSENAPKEGVDDTTAVVGEKKTSHRHHHHHHSRKSVKDAKLADDVSEIVSLDGDDANNSKNNRKKSYQSTNVKTPLIEVNKRKPSLSQKQNTEKSSKLGKLEEKSKKPKDDLKKSVKSLSDIQLSDGSNTSDTGSVKSRGHRHKHKSKHGKLGSGDVLRVRGPRNGVYKFRKLGSGENAALEDHLTVKNIQDADNYKTWRRNAQTGLPSNVGVPVENTNDVITLGFDTIGQEPRGSFFNPKSTYNSLYDEIHKKYVHLHHRKESQTSLHGENEIDKPIAAGQTLTGKIQAIRDLAEHLTEKRQFKEALKHVEKDASIFRQEKSWKEKLELVMIKIHRIARDIARWFTIWKSDIHFIHGKFGLGAASYFKWLRTIVALNVIQTIFVFCVILFPEIQLNSKPRDNNPNNITTCPSSVLKVKGCSVAPHIGLKKNFQVFDLITGAGSLGQNCYLYYSEYRDTQADPYCQSHKAIEFPDSFLKVTGIRYILVVIFIFLVNAFYVAVQVKYYYHNSEVQSKIPGLNKMEKLRALFSFWDFNVNDKEASEIMHKNIWRDMKDTLEDPDGTLNLSNQQRVKARRPGFENCMMTYFGDKGTYVVHAIITLFLLVTYTIVGFGLYAVFHRRQHLIHIDLTKCTPKAKIPTYLLLMPAALILFLYMFTGHLCAFLSDYESWSSEVHKNFTMIVRVGIMYCISIGVIYGFFILTAKDFIKNDLCHEDEFGQEFYRLVVTQGIFYIISSFIAYEALIYFQKLRHAELVRPKFDPVNYTIRLFYLQALSGIGFVFCPLISLLVLIRLVVTFYHHKRMLIEFYNLPTHVVQSSEILAPFLVSYILSFIITTCFNMVLISNLHPSTTCGPFSHLAEVQYHAIYKNIFSEDGFNKSTSKAVVFLTSPGFWITIVIFTIAFVYTLRTWGLCYLHTMHLLYRLLQLERKDRDFLLEAIYHLVKRQSKEDKESGIEKFQPPQEGKKSWVDSNVVQNIFKSRRGTMAGTPQGSLLREQPLKITKGGEDAWAETSESVEEKRKHGTVSRYLKDQFDWLPSQWKRRGRRSAKEDIITENDLKDLHRAFLEGLASLTSVSTETKEFPPSSVKVEQETKRRKSKLIPKGK